MPAELADDLIIQRADVIGAGRAQHEGKPNSRRVAERVEKRQRAGDHVVVAELDQPVDA